MTIIRPSADILETIDVGLLPSSTRERFALLAVVCTISSFWAGSRYAPIIATYTGIFLPLAVCGLYLLVVFFIIAGARYLSHPRRTRLAFGEPGVPMEATLIACNALSSKIDTPARFMSTANFCQFDAVTYGLREKTILMGAGLQIYLAKRIEIFRAILAHEIGHIRNRDVAVGHMSSAMVYATICISIGVIALHVIYSAHRVIFYYLFDDQYFGFGIGEFIWSLVILLSYSFELLFFVILVQFEYRAVLRSRELYADAYARLTVGRDDMNYLFAKDSNHSSIWERLWAFHPEIGVRLSYLIDPGNFFRPNFLEIFVSALYSGLVLQMFSMMWGSVFDQADTVQQFFELMFATNIYITIGILLVGLVQFVSIMVIASQCIRFCLLYSYGAVGLVNLFFGSVGCGVVYGVGFLVGVYINPMMYENLLFGDDYGLLYPSFFDIWMAIGVCIGILVANSIFATFFSFCARVSPVTQMARGKWVILLAIWSIIGFFTMNAVVSIAANLDGSIAPIENLLVVYIVYLGVTYLLSLGALFALRGTFSARKT